MFLWYVRHCSKQNAQAMDSDQSHVLVEKDRCFRLYIYKKKDCRLYCCDQTGARKKSSTFVIRSSWVIFSILILTIVILQIIPKEVNDTIKFQYYWLLETLTDQYQLLPKGKKMNVHASICSCISPSTSDFPCFTNVLVSKCCVTNQSKRWWIKTANIH